MNDIFKRYIPKAIRIPLLIYALFPHLMILSMFNMNSTFTASFLDFETDDLQFLFAIAYAMVVSGLFIHTRFFHFFNVRSYLLIMTSLSVVIVFAMTLTTNNQLMMILRFIQGPLILFEGCIILPVLMVQLKSRHAKIIAYSLLYCLMLTSDKFSTSLIRFAIENFNHNMMLYIIILFHIGTLIIYLVCLNNNRIFVKKPLYQLNLAGIVLLIVSLISGAYFLIYGKKYDWFESGYIVVSFSISLLFGSLFVWYQKTVKRPLYHFEIFRSPRVVFGVILFFLFYMIRASLSNLYQIMSIVWHWPWTNILYIQYFNVAGSILGVLLATVMLIKAVDFRYIFSLGFLLLAVSMIWFSAICFPDVSQILVAQPLFIEGVGQGVLFTPLVLYLTGGVDPNLASNAALTGTATRFWSSMIGFSIMQNLVLHLTTKHQNNLSFNLIPTNTQYESQWDIRYISNLGTHLSNDAHQLTAMSFKDEMVKQSILLTNVEIFYSLFWLGLAVSILCFLYRPVSNFVKMR